MKFHPESEDLYEFSAEDEEIDCPDLQTKWLTQIKVTMQKILFCFCLLLIAIFLFSDGPHLQFFHQTSKKCFPLRIP